MSLWGRRHERLEEVAADCRKFGAHVSIRAVDLEDVETAVAVLRDEDDAAPFDCAFFVAGIGDTIEPGRKLESASSIIRHGQINFIAPAALCCELGERMANRGRGRIGLIGTAAASHSLPFAAGYTASKSGIARFADAIRIALKPHGVSVTLISPGFFSGSSGSAPTYSRPGEISAERVASRAIRAVALGKAELVTPFPFRVLRWVGHVLPRPVRDRVLSALPRP
jgi:short-subunit dehydrogenase